MTDSGITLWYRPRPANERGTTRPIPCDPATIDLNKPTVFCFSGEEAITERDANGFAKIAETMLGGIEIHDQGVQFVTAHYENIGSIRKTSDTPAETAGDIKPWDKHIYPYAEKYASSIVDKVFDREEVIPDLAHKHDTARDEAIRQCARIMTNVNMLVYSFGSYLAPVIHKKLRALMEKRGFEDSEISATLKNVHVVSFGENGIWGQQSLKDADGKTPRKPWDFTSIHFASTQDTLAGGIAGITPEMLQGQHNRIFRLGEQDNVLLFFSKLPNTIEASRWAPGEAGSTAIFKSVEIPGNGHAPYGYAGTLDVEMYSSEEGGQWFMPSAIQSALRNCVATSLSGNRGKAVDLLKPVTLIEKNQMSESTRNTYMPSNPSFGYSERIEQMLKDSAHIELPQPTTGTWADMIRAHPPAQLAEDATGPTRAPLQSFVDGVQPKYPEKAL